MVAIVNEASSIRLSEEQEEERAARLHHDSCVVDALGVILNPLKSQQLPKELTHRAEKMLAAGSTSSPVKGNLRKMKFERLLRDERYQQLYVNGARSAGVNVLSHTVYPIQQGSSAFELATKEISRLKSLFRAFDYMIEIDEGKDIEDAYRKDKLSIILTFQNIWQLDFQDDASKLETFYNMGIQVIQLTYNMLSNVGCGYTERTDADLSYLGLQLVKKLNELGIVIDLSHCGYKTTMDAIEVSSDPVAFAHTTCRGVYNHHRGKTDEQIRGVAETDGYIGIVAVPYFLRDREEVTLADMLDHIEYAVDWAGIGHVGIGTDWPGRWYPESLAVKHTKECESKAYMAIHGFGPEQQVDTRTTLSGFENWTKFPNITRGLISRGYSDDNVQKILSENFIRVFNRVCK